MRDIGTVGHRTAVALALLLVVLPDWVEYLRRRDGAVPRRRLLQVDHQQLERVLRTQVDVALHAETQTYM